MKKKRSKMANNDRLAFKKLDGLKEEEEKKPAESTNFERCNSISKKIPKKFMSVL
jgi:hypothetical protein